MTDLINQAEDLFSEEIDAFAGTYQDVKDYLDGKPVHTSAQKWAKRAVTAATTVIPVGLSFKAATKGLKVAGKGIKASAHLSSQTRKAEHAKQADEIAKLKRQQANLKREAKVTKEIGRDVKDVTRVVYHATGDNEARKRRNTAAYDIAVYAQNPQELKKLATKKRKLISEKMRKDMVGGAADAAIKQLSARKYKKQPMTADDAKILGAQVVLGALKGARGTKSSRFGIKKNDKRWYTKLGTDLVGLNFCAVDKLGERNDVIISPAGTPEKVRVTTDAIIGLVLTVPNGADDPFTVATAKLANEMRLHSGANTIYTPQDVAEYMVNARAIMAGICQVRRFIMSLNNVDPTDVDAFKKYSLMTLGCLTAAVGTRYKDSRQNAANVLTDLNAIIKAVGMMIPINMPIMKRTEWLFSNAFADGKTEKYGTKMFIAQTLPKAIIDGNGDVWISQVDFLNDTASAMLNNLRKRVNEFVVDQKHMAIAGDIMKVYGSGAFWAPPLLDGTEPMPILYDEEALTQIQNMTIVSSPCINMTATGVTQFIQSGTVTTAIPIAATGQDAQYRLGRAYCREKRKVVQTYKARPDGGDTLELTRLVSFVNFDDPGEQGVSATDIICGTELVDYYGYILSRAEVGDSDYLNCLREHEIDSDAKALLFASCWSIDDWAPLVIIDYNSVTQAIVPLFDFETWASISNEQIKSYHYIAGVSLYTNEDPILKPTI